MKSFFLWIILVLIMSGCASYQHYFEPHSTDGNVEKAWCRGGFGPPNLVTFKVTYHDLSVTAARGNKNVSNYLNHPKSSSVVLVDIIFWLNWNETISIDPSMTIALDNQRKSLPIVMPSFLDVAYINPVDPTVAGKLVRKIVTPINGKISFKAPDTQKNTSAEIDIEVDVGSLKEFSVQLPPLTLSGFEYHFPEITFQEKEGMFFVPAFNC